MRQTIGFLAVVGIMAAWSPDNWLRRGNAAFERGDFYAALDCYSQAAGEASDPGQVAFNAAAAHYELGEFRNAELCYRRSLEDATGPRQVRALYGLANALAQEGGSRPGRAAVAQLTDAVHHYETAVQAANKLEVDEQLVVRDVVENAAYNRDLVQALLERKRAEVAKDNPPAGAENPESRPDDDRTRQEMGDPTMPHGQANGSPQKGNRGAPSEDTAIPPGSQSQATDETRPGKGNLPPLADDATGAPLSRDQALDYLQRHLERIRNERAARAARPGNAKGPRDW